MAKTTKPDSEEKSKLQTLKEAMETKYGKGTIISGRERPDFPVVSTGSLMFDKSTDCGGIPVGKLIEIYGPESSGKSTLSLHIIAEFQKQYPNKKCLLADYEYSFDKYYATSIGVDMDDIIITQPDTMEDGWNIIYEYVRSGEVSLVVIDSHTAMVPKARLEGAIGDSKMAPEARINSEALKKIKAELEKNQCSILGISQLRSQIGKMQMGKGQTPSDKPTGGNAWKFYSDMRIKIYKILDKDHEINKTVTEIAKNKCGKPFGRSEFSLVWGEGIDKVGEIIILASKFKLIKKSGSWYSLTQPDKEEVKIGQGANSVKKFFEDNPELYIEIKKEVINLYKDEAREVGETTEATEDDFPKEAILEDSNIEP